MSKDKLRRWSGAYGDIAVFDGNDGAVILDLSARKVSPAQSIELVADVLEAVNYLRGITGADDGPAESVDVKTVHLRGKYMPDKTVCGDNARAFGITLTDIRRLVTCPECLREIARADG